MAVALLPHMLHPHVLVPGTIDLGVLWPLLLEGQLFIAESQYSEGRCFAKLAAGTGRAVGAQSAVLLERFLLGERQKSLAIDFGVAISTIASHCTTALGSFVRTPNASHAPILVVMAAHAARGSLLPPAVVELREPDGGWLVHVKVPGASFADRLSRSEHAVAQLSIEGKNHAEMARVRRSSERTIANQLAACFRKLGVSGRGELRAKAVQEVSIDASIRVCA